MPSTSAAPTPRATERLRHWLPLRAWAVDERAVGPPPTVQQLLGVAPEDPTDRTELLLLALLAVSLDPDRIEREFALRAAVDTQASAVDLDALVHRQFDLTTQELGDNGGRRALLALALRDRLSAAGHNKLCEAINWPTEGQQSSEADRRHAWSAAARFGCLAQDLAALLDLNTSIPFTRFLFPHPDPTARYLPNAVACFNEPWGAGRRRALKHARDGYLVFEITTPPAGVVGVAHPAMHGPTSDRPHHFGPRRHPARETGGEVGHPIIAAIAPLLVDSHQASGAAPPLSSWQRFHPSAAAANGQLTLR